MPSPKTIENSLGYLSLLIKVKGATTSDEHIMPANIAISLSYNLKVFPYRSPVDPRE